MNKRAKIFLLGSWIALVLPMTLLGYGSEGDSWLIAKVALKIWEHKEYFSSRSTGFPLLEISLSPLVHFGGWYLANLLPFASGIGLILALIRLGEKDHLVHPIFVVLSIGFLPIVMRNASSTMDYIPALALLIWSYYAMVSGSHILCAILIGLACGFRPTSGLMIIPCMVFVYGETKNVSLPVKLFFIAFFVGVLSFSPALLKYNIIQRLWWPKVDSGIVVLKAGYNLLKLFGIVQTVILTGVFIYYMKKRITNEKGFLSSPFTLFHVTNIFVWLSLFCVLSDKAEYLLPMIPSVILLIDRLVPRKVFAALTILLLSYHLIALDALGGESGHRFIEISVKPGYTIKDVQDRIFEISIRKIATRHSTERKTLLMNWRYVIALDNDEWYFDDEFRLHRQKNGNLFVSGIIRDESKLRELRDRGFRLVVWRGEKWEYVRLGPKTWKNYVEVVDSMEEFFGEPVPGERKINYALPERKTL